MKFGVGILFRYIIFILIFIFFTNFTFAMTDDEILTRGSATPNPNDRNFHLVSSISKIDPYSGEMTIHLPIVEVPENDGISLKLTLSHRDMPSNLSGITNLGGMSPDQAIVDVRGNHLAHHWYTFVGIITSTRDMSYKFKYVTWPEHPIFIDPDGTAHHMYSYFSSTEFISKDNWYGRLSKVGKRYVGEVFSPDGTRYIMRQLPQAHVYLPNYAPVTEIESVHKTTKIKYNYDSNSCLTSITDGRYTLYFSFKKFGYYDLLYRVKDNLNRIWEFNYNPSFNTPGTPRRNFYKAVPVLKTITLPDRRSWVFGYTQGPEYSAPINYIKNPIGGVKTFNYEFSYRDYEPIHLGTRLAPAHVVSVKQKSNQYVKGASWKYYYDIGTWNNNCNAAISGNFGRKKFGNHTMIIGPSTIEDYYFNNESDAVLFLGKGGSHCPAYMAIDYPVPTQKTGVLNRKEIWQNVGNHRNRLLQKEVYQWQYRHISNQAEFIATIKKHPTWPYNPTSGIYAPMLMAKTVYRNPTSKHPRGDVFSAEYINHDKFGRPGVIKEHSNDGRVRINRLKYLNGFSHWLLEPITEKKVDNIGVVEKNYFNSKLELVKTTRLGITTEFKYKNGLISEKIEPENRITHYSNYQNGIPKLITRNNNSKLLKSINIDGTIVSDTDGEGNTTYYHYDSMKRVIKLQKPLGNPTVWNYNVSGRVGFSTEQRGDYFKSTQLDGFGRVIEVIERDAKSGKQRKHKFAYDAEGREVFQSYPCNPALSSCKLGLFYTYDGLGQITRKSEPTFNNSQTKPVIKYSYDANSVTKRQSPAHTKVNKYLHFSEPEEIYLKSTTILLPSSHDNLSMVITRDLLGRITSVKQASIAKTYHYNSHFLMDEKFIPEVGKTIYSYNDAGQVKSEYINSSLLVKYNYDLLGRPSDIIYPHNYNSVHREYDNNDRIKLEAKGATKREYDYNKNGSLTSEKLKLSGGQYEIDYEYDLNDHLNALKYPNQSKIYLNPDAFGLITKIPGIIGSADYFSDDSIKTLSYSNGGTLEALKNNINILHRYTFRLPGVKFGREYHYNRDKNISEILDINDASKNIALIYDEADRLVTANGPWGKIDYGYDNLNNRTRKTVNGKTTNYAYDYKTNHLKSTSGSMVDSFDYDSYGNVKSSSKWGYEFLLSGDLNKVTDKNDNLVSVYNYDGHHRRVRVQDDESDLIEFYNRDNLLLYEHDLKNNISVNHVYLSGNKIAELKSKDNKLVSKTFFHFDSQGSPIAASDQAGKLLWQQHYKPFGSLIEKANSRREQAYIGQKFDSKTELSYLGARYYHPELGRFLSVDPVSFDESDLYSFNKYIYANNNSYKYSDPDGTCPMCIPVAIGALEAAGVTIDVTETIAFIRTLQLVHTLDKLHRESEQDEPDARTNVDRDAKLKKPPNPYGRRGGPEHREVIKNSQVRLEKKGWKVRSGGTGPERKVNGRYPDLEMKRGNKRIAIQVGKATRSGRPIARERRAINDLRDSEKFDHVFFRKYN